MPVQTFATVPSGWQPIPGSQYLSPASSTALSVPVSPVASPNDFGALLLCQDGDMYVSLDGVAVTASSSKGLHMRDGDYIILRGMAQIVNVRTIASVPATSYLAVTYYVSS